MLVLRCAEQAGIIHHVPRLLCLRGGSQWIDDAEMEAAALTRAAERRGIAAEVMAGAVPGTWRLRRTEPVTGMVSIIIPTCAARGYIETCIKLAARAHRVSQLRDRLRRQYSRQPGRLEDLAAAERRQDRADAG